MSVGRATVTVGGLTGLSRLAGLVRDLLIAAALGAGPVADAFFVSFKLANFLRRLFAEGAFSAAFVPFYGRLIENLGQARARRLAGEVLATLAVLLAGAVLLGELLMPWVVRALASGFAAGSPRHELAVELGRATFPYLWAISLAALLGAVLQAGHRFAAAAFAPLLFNLALIAALLATGASGEAAARLLAWCVVLSGLLQLAWLFGSARRAGLAPKLAPPSLSPVVRRLMSLIGPGVLGVGIVQVNTLVSSWFATYLAPGSVAYLFYADRLIQFPLGIVGVALGTALLPTLSVAVRSGRPGHGALQRAVELALLLGLPAGVGLLLLAEPIIAVLFERGAFDPAATKATAQVLAGLALGVPAQVLSRVLAAGFFALEDTRTPVRVALLALGVNIVAATALVGPLTHTGIALASALSSWTGTLGLGFLLRRRGLLVLDAALARRAAGILAAVAAMSLVLTLLMALAPEPGLAALGGLIAAGATTFMIVALVAGGVEPGTWRWIWRDTRA